MQIVSKIFLKKVLTFHANVFNFGPAEPGYALPLQTELCSSRPEDSNRSGSALFAIKYANLYQQPGSSNLIGWQLEVGMAS